MSDPKFALWAHLKGDVRRYQILVKGRTDGDRRLSSIVGFFSPRLLPVLLCRTAYWCGCHRLGFVAKAISTCNFIIFGIEIATRCRIGSGLVLPHTQGTVIGAVSIGENATIFQGATIGAKGLEIEYSESNRPILGDGVMVGAGAMVLGGIRVGNNVKIGANSVVIRSLPDDVVAAGVPAIVIKSA